jgi:maleate cis-trans isomerase
MSHPMSTLSASLPPLHAGLMVPANNTTMERELLGWLPAGSTCQTLRIPRGKGLLTSETVPAYQAASLTVAEGFAPGLDIIVYGCTAASFIAGLEADRALASQLATMHATQVVTATASMLQELGEAGATAIGLVTPYSDEVNASLTAVLAGAGIAVTQIERLPAPDVEALGRLTAQDAAAAACRLDGRRMDAAFIACSQLPTAAILAQVSLALGVPVLSSIQASAAQAMKRAGAHGESLRPMTAVAC